MRLEGDWSPWQKFHTWNTGHKWDIAWRKGDKHLVFNEGGWYIALYISIQPMISFRFFLYLGFPIVISINEKTAHKSP